MNIWCCSTAPAAAAARPAATAATGAATTAAAAGPTAAVRPAVVAAPMVPAAALDAVPRSARRAAICGPVPSAMGFLALRLVAEVPHESDHWQGDKKEHAEHVKPLHGDTVSLAWAWRDEQPGVGDADSAAM